MLKYLICVGLICFIFLSKSDYSQQVYKENFIIDKKMENREISFNQLIYNKETHVNEKNTGVDIWSDDIVNLSANVTTSDENGLADKSKGAIIPNIKVINIKKMENGDIYKLSINDLEDIDGYLSPDRVNIYFYVKEDKTYRIWSYIIENDELIEFYDNDKLLLEKLNTDEKIIQNSYIVYQNEILEENVEGLHKVIEINQDYVTSRLWNVKLNGETDYYERFVWDTDNNLISYISGFSAERDVLSFENLKISK